MSAVEYVGYRKVDYVSKTGKSVSGYSLYFNEKRDYVVGLAAFDAWVSNEVYQSHFANLNFGEIVSLNYDRYGKLVSINK